MTGTRTIQTHRTANRSPCRSEKSTSSLMSTSQENVAMIPTGNAENMAVPMKGIAGEKQNPSLWSRGTAGEERAETVFCAFMSTVT